MNPCAYRVLQGGSTNAGMDWNGMDWNGMDYWNGLEWNGLLDWPNPLGQFTTDWACSFGFEGLIGHSEA